MERFIVALLFFSVTSCQSLINEEIIFEEVKKPDEIQDIIVIENEIEPELVWDHLKKNAKNKNYKINNTTQKYIYEYTKNTYLFEKYLERSEYYIFYVVQELKKKDLPLEFAFIPFIESNYDPFSISASGAVGLWQFMPRTGESLDLNKTWWIEERHDPFKSTKAAISYLDILYKRFNEDMYLTLAAYNAGPSYIDKQIKRNKRKNKPSDYWSIKLSKETQNYIPKFIAINEIIFNNEKYNVTLPEIYMEQVVAKVVIPGQIEILALSDHLNIKPELIYKLNAGYTKWASPPSYESIFYLPIEKAEFFNSNNNEFKKTNDINWLTHEIVNGDNLWSLARKYDTEVSIIKQVNYLQSNLLKPGSNLLIPVSKNDNEYFVPFEMHIVSEGDSIWSISRKYNISVDDIIEMNNLDPNKFLQLGQQLSIGNKNIYRNIDSKKRTILYSVKQGDNLYKIANIFDVNVESILKINELDEFNLIPGQIIKVSIRAF